MQTVNYIGPHSKIQCDFYFKLSMRSQARTFERIGCKLCFS
jgi:hypothetical protein